MNIIHFSISPLAGAPINIIKSLRKFSDDNIRLIDLKRWNLFEHDIVFNEEKDFAVELAESADIIHLHNYVTLDSYDFSPLNFRDLLKKGKRVIVHYHSSPQLISQTTGFKIEDVISPEVPSIVISQFQERFYPNSKVVPNIISPKINEIKQNSEISIKNGVFYSPTNKLPAFSNKHYSHVRWNTKGYYEIRDILRKVRRERGIDFSIFRKKKFIDTVKEKWKYPVVIDDVITGSFHLTGLEALSMGKIVFSYLDNRTQYVLSEITGTNSNPFYNVRMEDLEFLLIDLFNKEKDLIELGNLSKEWSDKYWNDKLVANRYLDTYKDLMVNPELVTRQNTLKINDTVKKYRYIEMPDIVFKSRNSVYLKNRNIKTKIRDFLASLFDKKRFGVAAKEKDK